MYRWALRNRAFDQRNIGSTGRCFFPAGRISRPRYANSILSTSRRSQTTSTPMALATFSASILPMSIYHFLAIGPQKLPKLCFDNDQAIYGFKNLLRTSIECGGRVLDPEGGLNENITGHAKDRCDVP